MPVDLGKDLEGTITGPVVLGVGLMVLINSPNTHMASGILRMSNGHML